MIICGLKIDKRFGRWNYADATDLDNIAYFFYLELTKENRKQGGYSALLQTEYMRMFPDGRSYNNARLYLRNYKIKKIKEKCGKK